MDTCLIDSLIHQQATVKQPFVLEGVGVHGGRPAKVKVSPLEPNSGIWIELKQGKHLHRFPVVAGYVMPYVLATCLGTSPKASVKTVEHLLSALFGLGIDNALITVIGDEIPIMDGSSWPFVQCILGAGIERYVEPKKWMSVSGDRTFTDRQSSIRFTSGKLGSLRIVFHIEYGHPQIKRQSYTFDFLPSAYVTEISKARTYGFLKDAQKLHAMGLALGASEDNTIILTEKGISNVEPLRYGDEFVRHKVLDALGDLAVCGFYPSGTLEYIRSGHGLNGQLAQWLFDLMQDEIHHLPQLRGAQAPI
jgi:UDP-3-O-[3-hydroxymyristoyl] N-acetylglucosamine deacetylase